MNKETKKLLTIVVGFFVAVILTFGVSYAYWMLVKTQASENEIATGCFDITYTDGPAINLSEAYPMKNAAGMKLVPYTFKIKNTCTAPAGYQVNLEVLDTSTLSSNYMAVSLNGGVAKNIVDLTTVTPILSNIQVAKKLTVGHLIPGEEVTYDLRMWMRDDTPNDSSAQNKVYNSKITIVASLETAPCAGCGGLRTAESGVTATTNFLNAPIMREQIEELVFATTNVVPSALIATSADVSAAGDGSVKMWWEPVGVDGRYKVTIGSEGGVKANSNSRVLFYLMVNLNKLDLTNFYTYGVTDMYYMFASAGLNSSSYTLNLGDHFDTKSVTNMESIFNRAGFESSIFTLDLGDKFDTSSVTNMQGLFYNTGYANPNFTLNLGDKFDTSSVTNISYIFANTAYSSTVFTLNLGDKFDTSKVTNMSNMFTFAGYSSPVFTLDLGDKFDTGLVTNMESMFNRAGYGSLVFTLDLGHKFDTKNVTNMKHMFSHCGYESLVLTLNLGNKFDTSKVRDMYDLFYRAGYKSPVFTLNLGDKFNTSNAVYMQSIFNQTGYSSPIYTINLGDKFNTSSAVDMRSLFYQAGYSNPTFILDLGSLFDTSNVTNMDNMFRFAGDKNPTFTVNMKTMSFEANPTKVDMLTGIRSTSKIYVKDATAVTFISSGAGLPAGVTVVNCASSTCP